MLNCGSVARPEAPPSKAEGLLEAWESFGLDGPGPTRDDFTPFNLKPWLGYIDIYQVERSGCAAAPEFRLRLNGSKVVALTGEEWTGHTAREIDRVLGGHLQGDLLEVFRSEAPSSNPVRLYRKTYIVAHRLLLPVYSNCGSGRVEQIFLALFDPYAP